MATPDREEIIGLREQGMTREKIAEHYDVSITTVRRWIKQHNIPRPSKQARRKRESHLSRNGEIIAPLKDERPILEQAQEILGERFTEKRFVGYVLDGRPAHVDAIIAAAGLVPHKI
jgi:transposase